MKFNLKMLLVGGILGGAIALIPALTQAQETGSQFPKFPALEQLNLTTDQEAKLAQIRQDTRTQLEDLLTVEQQETLRTKLSEGATFREAIAAMNPSEGQRTQIRDTFRSARQSASEVLTPAQRQQAREWRQSRPRNR
ncbi:MAG: Spy/CpxP family protein refolding chaperone [Phormidesmis sp. CAN_BIN36]|nr:Spy/CpxP family protein refolding chaperone [Phormidesmis sp. CAN_BIN36]